MSGMTECDPMTPEQTKRAEIINGRLNALSIDVKGNLNTMLEINGIMFGSELANEGKCEGKREATGAGWFNSVIDMLITISNNNTSLKKEIVKLRKEFKK